MKVVVFNHRALICCELGVILFPSMTPCNRGEFQLTSVLDRMREQDDGMLGCIIHGDALDMGIPNPYVDTMGAFAKPHSSSA